MEKIDEQEERMKNREQSVLQKIGKEIVEGNGEFEALSNQTEGNENE